MEKFKTYQRDKGYTEQTITTYTKTVTAFCNWCKDESVNYKKVNYNELMSYIESLRLAGNKTATIINKIHALDRYFDFLGKPSNKVFLIKLQGRIRKVPHKLLDKEELTEIYKLQHLKGLAAKRDKVLLSLVVFQGVGSNQLDYIEVSDVDLLEGKIYIPSTRISNSRTLDLHPAQLLLLQTYILDTRKAILEEHNRTSQKLLVSRTGVVNESMHGVITRILRSLRKEYPKLQSLQQIRQSLITIWIKEHGLRQAQYMAGHRYVSSTERYNVEKLEGLKEEVDKYFDAQL